MTLRRMAMEGLEQTLGWTLRSWIPWIWKGLCRAVTKPQCLAPLLLKGIATCVLTLEVWGSPCAVHGLGLCHPHMNPIIFASMFLLARPSRFDWRFIRETCEGNPPHSLGLKSPWSFCVDQPALTRMLLNIHSITHTYKHISDCVWIRIIELNSYF